MKRGSRSDSYWEHDNFRCNCHKRVEGIKKAVSIKRRLFAFGGGYRTRTDHLKHAMLALYQMS